MKNKKLLLIILPIILIILGICYYLLTPITTITLNGKDHYDMNLNDKYFDQGVKACKTNRLLKNKKCHELINIKTTNNINKNKIGTYEVSYKVNNKEIKRKVIVKDTTPPIINLVPIKNENKCPLKNFIEPGYTAIDNYDGDITNKVTISNKNGTYLYTVSDNSGNTTTIKREFVNVDTIKPIITLKGFNIQYIVLNNTYKEKGYTATDNCDGNLNSKVQITGNVNTTKEGTYPITYEVTDSSNNKTTITRNVKVYQKKDITTIIPTNKTIYLTFDDGPSSYTGQLLDTLDYYGVKATFFVTYKTKYKATIKRAYDSGHTIALHTASHSYKKIYSSINNYFIDLNKINSFVKSITGEKSYLVRFPGGSSNTVSKAYSKGIMTNLVAELNTQGYKYFDWNVSSGDTVNSSSSKIANNVIKNLKNGAYYIVLQHDTKKASINAVPAIIEYGLKNGYTFAPLTISSPTAHQHISN